MDQATRGQILSAALGEMGEEKAPELPAETLEPAPEAEVEAAPEEAAAEPPPEPKLPKRRLDEEIRKKREAEQQAQYWKGRAEAVVQPQQVQERSGRLSERLQRLQKQCCKVLCNRHSPVVVSHRC